ncbi:MAG TPA: hypothetical protein VEF72_06585 [Mycobacterium sp.]|nr:hypothetical protein [Mycobacterium sp.]
MTKTVAWSPPAAPPEEYVGPMHERPRPLDDRDDEAKVLCRAFCPAGCVREACEVPGVEGLCAAIVVPKSGRGRNFALRQLCSPSELGGHIPVRPAKLTFRVAGRRATAPPVTPPTPRHTQATPPPAPSTGRSPAAGPSPPPAPPARPMPPPVRLAPPREDLMERLSGAVRKVLPPAPPPPGVTTIGRADTNAIVVDDPLASRKVPQQRHHTYTALLVAIMVSGFVSDALKGWVGFDGARGLGQICTGSVEILLT